MSDIEKNKAASKKKDTQPSLADNHPLNANEEREKQTSDSTATTNPSEHVENKCLCDKSRKKERIKLIIESLVAIGTIGNVIVFWIVSNNQRIDTLKSIQVDQENFRIEKGALLASSQPTLSFYNGPGEKYTVYLTITNFGKTVADSVFYWFNCVVSDKKIPYNPKVKKEFPNISFFVLPGAGFQVGDTIKRKYIDRTGMRLVNGRIKVFFYGEVRYKSLGRFDTLQFMSRNTSDVGEFESYGTFNKLR
ncbi:MAG: hypothetical protein WBW71_15920 [Bacteroidota bacterium]